MMSGIRTPDFVLVDCRVEVCSISAPPLVYVAHRSHAKRTCLVAPKHEAGGNALILQRPQELLKVDIGVNAENRLLLALLVQRADSIVRDLGNGALEDRLGECLAFLAPDEGAEG